MPAPPFLGAEGDYGPVRLAMERAIRAYRPKDYPGFVTVFRATNRIVTGTYGRTLGWKPLARGGIRVIDISGDHVTMLQGDAARVLAMQLAGSIS
jgi:thioesterase domain-containing protein